MHIILGKKDTTLSTEKVSSMVTLTLGHVGWSMCRLRWQRAVPGVRLVDKLSGPRASNVIRIEAWSWNHVLFVSWYRLMMYPLVNIQKLWKIHFFNGKINYKWPMFYSYVKLPEGNIIPIYLICIYIYYLYIYRIYHGLPYQCVNQSINYFIDTFLLWDRSQPFAVVKV